MCEKLNVHKIQSIFKIRGRILDSFSIKKQRRNFIKSCVRVRYVFVV
jgi:hypothetical protein